MISVFEGNAYQHVTERQMAFISQTRTSRRHLKQDYFTKYLILRDFQLSMWRHRNFVKNELVSVFSLVRFALVRRPLRFFPETLVWILYSQWWRTEKRRYRTLVTGMRAQQRHSV